MANLSSGYPAEYFNSDDDEYYVNESPEKLKVDLRKNLDEQSVAKIKLIRPISIEAGLERRDFDISLDNNSQQWFDQIYQYWKQYKKSPVLSSVIQKFYQNVSDPFLYALKFFANASDHSNPKSNSFAYTILDELAKFKKMCNLDTALLLDDNKKMVAFNFLKKSGQITAFRLVVDIFELIKSKHLFTAEIRDLVAMKHFKEAGQIAFDLELYNDFSIDEFLIPLILQDKLGIFEDYLDKAVNLRVPMIQLLDSFLQRDSSVRQVCDYYIRKYELQDVKYEKLNKKTVAKLLNRLLRKYQLPDSISPNMKKQKEFGSLFFILRKNFIEKSLNKASFEEMVKDTIGTENKELQQELVCSCVNYGSLEDAIKWTKYYNVDLSEVPKVIRDNINNDKFTNFESTINENDNYSVSLDGECVHTLPLNKCCVILVNEIELYREMINDLQTSKIISFDTEWKPTILSCSDVSLIQLAKRDRIYLVDVITLMQHNMSSRDWSLLGRCIFNNEEILKLGFAHSTDISMLVKFQAFGIQHNQSSHSYLDLQGLWQKVINFPDFRFPFHEDVSSQSLSNLVKLCLGKKLDKSNQFSNWQQRPLRAEQITYAALDAFCLFEIYDIIGNAIVKLGINYDELINNILMENKRDIASLTKKESRQRSQSSQHQQQQQQQHPLPDIIYRQPKSIREISFVTDYMIGGVGKILRQVGIDTRILKGDYVDHDECIKYSQNENRIILTASKPLCSRYQKYTKPGFSYVLNNLNDIAALEEIIKTFKINIKREYIFSRCMVCNCDEFLIASKLDLIRLKYNNMQLIPNDLMPFLMDVEESSAVGFPEHKAFFSWRRYKMEQATKYGTKINADSVADGTLRVFQTFYICESCSKIYYDGGHYQNTCGGKFDHLLNLFPDANKA